MTKRLCSQILAVLAVTAMAGLAESVNNTEVIFPEIAAVAIGFLAAPVRSWNTDNRHTLILIAICSLFGYLCSVISPMPMWVNVILAYLCCQILFLYSGTGFAPMISAAVLPILMETKSFIYPVSAVLFTAVILLFRWISEQAEWKKPEKYTPQRDMFRDSAFRKRAWKSAWMRLGMVAVLAVIAVPAGIKFVIAPPVLVAFTEWTNPENKAMKKPVKAVLVIFLCALSGALARHFFGDISLTLAALAACILFLSVLNVTGMYLPPAGALAILPMVIPESALALYPFEVAAGAALLMTAAVKVFHRNKA